MAGMIAALCEELPHNIGYLNPLLKTMPATCFSDIVRGDNGGYSAKPGPDLCTGRGSPKPLAMLAALQGTAPPPVTPPPVTPPPVGPPPPLQPPPNLTVLEFASNLRASLRKRFTADLKSENHIDRWANSYFAKLADDTVAAEIIK
jgi:hypothetical protein